jgi:hypothetical protein
MGGGDGDQSRAGRPLGELGSDERIYRELGNLRSAERQVLGGAGLQQRDDGNGDGAAVAVGGEGEMYDADHAGSDDRFNVEGAADHNHTTSRKQQGRDDEKGQEAPHTKTFPA